MVSIFTSPTKLVIETQADPQIVLHKLRERMTDRDFISRLANSFSISANSWAKQMDGMLKLNTAR